MNYLVGFSNLLLLLLVNCVCSPNSLTWLFDPNWMELTFQTDTFKWNNLTILFLWRLTFFLHINGLCVCVLFVCSKYIQYIYILLYEKQKCIFKNWGENYNKIINIQTFSITIVNSNKKKRIEKIFKSNKKRFKFQFWVCHMNSKWMK